MGSLLEKFAGKIDLIYIDPPFATGADFSFRTPIGADKEALFTKDRSILEELAYRDTWSGGVETYLSMMSSRLRLLHELVAIGGSCIVHCDWHVGFLLRSLLDEIFGPGSFLNEIVWHYYNKFQGNVNRFASNHDVLLWYRKGERHLFRRMTEKRLEGKVEQLVRVWDKEKKAIVNARGEDGKVLYRTTDERTVDDVWRLPMLQPADKKENFGYPTQKPEPLLQRAIEATTETRFIGRRPLLRFWNQRRRGGEARSSVDRVRSGPMGYSHESKAVA